MAKFLTLLAVLIAAGHASAMRVHVPSRTQRSAMTMAIDLNSDWYSTAALNAEDMLSTNPSSDAMNEEKLQQVQQALDVAVRTHSVLRRKVQKRLNRLRSETASWYLTADGLDH